jgi:hypothetical protein
MSDIKTTPVPPMTAEEYLVAEGWERVGQNTFQRSDKELIEIVQTGGGPIMEVDLSEDFAESDVWVKGTGWSLPVDETEVTIEVGTKRS